MLAAVVPVAWGWGLVLARRRRSAVGLLRDRRGSASRVGFHRYFTHGSFKANRPLRIALAAGRLAWRSRAPSSSGSPTTAGTTRSATGRATRTRRGATARRSGRLIKGLFYAHIGWLFDRELSNRERFAPDLLEDKDIQRVDQLFPAGRGRLGRCCPALIGGLVTWSWQGALSAFFWAGLVRIGAAAPRHLVDQLGLPRRRRAPVRHPRRDQATNFWPLAILSFGESWHNLHHADPTCARHGVAARPDRHQRPADLDLREARLGPRRALAEARTGWRPSWSEPDQRHGERVTR